MEKTRKQDKWPHVEPGSILDQLGWDDYDLCEAVVGLMLARERNDCAYKYETGWERKNKEYFYEMCKEKWYQRSHLSIEVGKKYLTRNEESVFVFAKEGGKADEKYKAIVVGGSDLDILEYRKDGRVNKTNIDDWDIIGEA